MKKLFNSLLIICLAVCTFAMMASAKTVGGKCGKNADWSIDTDTGAFTVSGSGEMDNYDPRTTPWNGYLKQVKTVTVESGITSIGEWSFAFCEELTSVAVPDGVKTIGDSSFCGCTKLSDINIPNSVTDIGGGAFVSCVSLTEITLPDSVTSIGEMAFSGCTGLMNTEGDMVYYKISGNPHFYFSNSTNYDLTSCTVNENTKFIAAKAFFGSRFLEEVNLPEGLISIGDSAFSGCTALKSITVPSTLKSIGNEAFSGCERATGLTVPVGVTSIGYRSFYNCKKITDMPLPSGITSIGDEAFLGCNITSISIPDSVTSIGEQAFYGCMKLESLSIGNGVKSIEKGAFWNCVALKSVSLPSSVTSIGEWAFSGCSAMSEATVYSSVASFGDKVFANTSKAFVLYAYKGSTAEDYALKNKHTFVALPDNRVIMAIDSTDALVAGNSVVTDVPPIIENNRTMLPARFVAEALGATVSWDGATRTATIVGNGVTIQITVDSTTAYINGEAVTLDSPAFIRNNRTYTPVRFIAEALGAKVEWNGTKRQAIITK